MSKQTTDPSSYHEDEIDLRKLFQSIGRLFVNLGHRIINIILVVRRTTINYRYLLIVAIIIGGISGGTFTKYSEHNYQTSLLLKSTYLTAKLVENSIDNLNILCGEAEPTALAKALNIKATVAKNILAFKYEPLINETDLVEIELLKQRLVAHKLDKIDIENIIKQSELENSGTFILSVTVLDTQLLEDVQEGLVDYFKNSPYVANRIKFNNVRQERVMIKLTNDIAMIDSLKRAYNLNLQRQANSDSESSTSVFLGDTGGVDPVPIYIQSIALFNTLQAAKLEYDLGSHFEVIDSFGSFTTPGIPSIKNAIVYSMGVFLAVAYLLIVLLETNKYLNRIEKEGFKN